MQEMLDRLVERDHRKWQVKPCHRLWHSDCGVAPENLLGF